MIFQTVLTILIVIQIKSLRSDLWSSVDYLSQRLDTIEKRQQRESKYLEESVKREIRKEQEREDRLFGKES